MKLIININLFKVRNEEVIVIYDSFVNQIEEELFLCDTNMGKNKWLRRDHIRPLKTLFDFIETRVNDKDLACNTDKSLAYTCDLKVRTRGIQICATNCGIILAFREMFLSETKHQVAIMYVDISNHFNGMFPVIICYIIKFIKIIIGCLPEYIIYDDGCHLKQFVDSRINNTEKTKVFKDKKIVVDKLHIQGHKDHRCLETCHPNLFPDLADVNTVIVEQINFWVGGFKYITKHMNIYRFNFFLFLLFDHYNELTIEGKFSLLEEVVMNKSEKIKRKREEESEVNESSDGDEILQHSPISI